MQATTGSAREEKNKIIRRNQGGCFWSLVSRDETEARTLYQGGKGKAIGEIRRWRAGEKTVV